MYPRAVYMTEMLLVSLIRKCQKMSSNSSWNYVLENIALGKPTFQSSTIYNGDSSRAVDGNKATDYYGGNSCTHTIRNAEGLPWWGVDLLERHLVDRVNLTNRGQCDGCGKLEFKNIDYESWSIAKKGWRI